jgi:hypothetical protein
MDHTYYEIGIICQRVAETKCPSHPSCIHHILYADLDVDRERLSELGSMIHAFIFYAVVGIIIFNLRFSRSWWPFV